MPARPERRIDESATRLRLQKPHHLFWQNGRVSKHASSDSQFRVVFVCEQLTLHAVDEPLMIPDFQIIQRSKDSDFSRHLGGFTKQSRNQNPTRFISGS